MALNSDEQDTVIRDKKRYRFSARTVADAYRKAREVMGEEIGVISVNADKSRYKDGTRIPMVEIDAIRLDKLGIPSMIEFFNRDPNAQSTQDTDSFPARYRLLWDQLRKTGMRSDQATILCREAWVGDPELKLPPWRRVLTILAKDVPCDRSMKLAEPQILGLVGESGCGRSSVAWQMCRQATLQDSDGVVLVSEDAARLAQRSSFEVIELTTPQEVAAKLAQIGGLRLAVVDMPPVIAANLGFYLQPWSSTIASMKMVPVITAEGVTAGVTLIHALQRFGKTGWVMTHVDGPDTLGVVANLAMATHGPLGFQGKVEESNPQFSVATWRNIVHKMMDFTATMTLAEDEDEA